jgi:hypothetical protein
MFVGRLNELRLLNEAYGSARSEFFVLYGRRRIGKSTLLEKACIGKPVFVFQGGKESKRLMLRRFASELGTAINDSLTTKTRIEEWAEALLLLDRAIPALLGKQRKVIIAFDEFQWMCENCPELVSDLQRIWDNHWKNSGNVFLVLCGSSISFMLGEVLGEKSPLFGRRTMSLHLRAFNLHETSRFFPKRNIFEVAEIFMACGGIPKYLEIMRNDSSFQSSMEKQFFSKDGFFFEEVNFILSEQLREKERYFEILRLISRGVSEISVLEHVTGINSGQISHYMDRLQLLGFVTRHIPITAKLSSKTVRYRLDDYYLRFYFALIDPYKESIRKIRQSGMVKSEINRKWDSYAGHTFEYLARDHAEIIARIAGHPVGITSIGSYWQRPTKKKKGVQIDLLIECADKVTLVCECKWSRSKVGIQAANSLDEKIKYFPNPKNHTLKPVLIAAQGLTGDINRQRFLSVVTLADLFANQESD